MLKRLRRRFARMLHSWSEYEATGSMNRSPTLINNSSPNSGIDEAAQLRDGIRDMRRNNPYAAAAIRSVASNIVNHGLIPIFKSNDSDFKFKNIDFSDTWHRWGDKVECDADGRLNFIGLQSAIVEGVVESGEVFVRARWRKPNFIDKHNLSLPLQLQLLESDYLISDTYPYISHKVKIGRGNVLKSGIEFDQRGQRVAYHFYKSHPNDPENVMPQTVRVDVKDVIHIYRMDRPGQLRGIPWLANVYTRLKGIDEYNEAQLKRQKIAASYVAFLLDSDPITTNQPVEEVLDSLNLKPGTVQILPPGKDMKFASPPGVDGYYEVIRENLRAIAAGVGVSYESLSGDYSTSNFSSSRMGHLETDRNYNRWRNSILYSLFLEKVKRWIITAFEIKHEVYPDFEWSRSRREMYDPKNEMMAFKLKVENGYPLSWGWNDMGFDSKRLFKQLAEDKKNLEELGFTPAHTAGLIEKIEEESNADGK